MLNRRSFLKSIAAAATVPSAATLSRTAHAEKSPLRSDRNGILDLADGLRYTIVSRAGDRMDDGFQVPIAHDGMAAFTGEDGRIVIVCNHEMDPKWLEQGPFGKSYDSVRSDVLRELYDPGSGRTPSMGGTTTTVYDPQRRRTEKQFLSLCGTELNCAGGKTPWNTWLSCEECFESPGTRLEPAPAFTRDRRHGYVFEVSAYADGLQRAVPLKAMGRFEHEACAVHEPTGIVYMTEDRHHSLFYRFIPDVPGKLAKGGRLQALAVAGKPSLATHNWSSDPAIGLNAPLETRWIDIEDPDPLENTVRTDGAARGAAMFARGEGLCDAGDRFAFTCTIGGPARLGQVFTYTPSPFEGTDGETGEPGRLELIAEAGENSLLRNADNLTMAPWGDLIVCEDTSDHCGLVGIRPDGSQYPIADNPYSDSELAGVCFSPDGAIMFVNVQYPGMTLAITGDWRTSVA